MSNANFYHSSVIEIWDWRGRERGWPDLRSCEKSKGHNFYYFLHDTDSHQLQACHPICQCCLSVHSNPAYFLVTYSKLSSVLTFTTCEKFWEIEFRLWLDRQVMSTRSEGLLPSNHCCCFGIKSMKFSYMFRVFALPLESICQVTKIWSNSGLQCYLSNALHVLIFRKFWVPLDKLLYFITADWKRHGKLDFTLG